MTVLFSVLRMWPQQIPLACRKECCMHCRSILCMHQVLHAVHTSKMQTLVCLAIVYTMKCLPKKKNGWLDQVYWIPDVLPFARQGMSLWRYPQQLQQTVTCRAYPAPCLFINEYRQTSDSPVLSANCARILYNQDAQFTRHSYRKSVAVT